MDLERIVDAALELLDERGLPDLSMRAVAASLGVQPSALYWHVRNKQQLLGLIADRIVAEAGDGDGLADQVLRLRTALLAHRDGAELVASSIALGMGGGAIRSTLRRAAERQSQSADRAPAVVEALALVLLGHTQLEQQRQQALEIGIDMGEGEPAPSLPELVSLIIAGAVEYRAIEGSGT